MLKKTRQLYAGQWGTALSYTEMPQWHLDHFNIKIDEYVKHHDSHAAAGYFTSPFKEAGATILTVDAIGEWETVQYRQLTKFGLREKKQSTIHTQWAYFIQCIHTSLWTETCRRGIHPDGHGRIRHTKVQTTDIRRLRLSVTISNLRRILHRGLSDWQPERRCDGHSRQHTSSHRRMPCRPLS